MPEFGDLVKCHRNPVFGNHLGVPLVTTDSTGALATTPNNYFLPGFPGQSRIIADLYYNRYRDYDPTTGRYIQGDPIGLGGGSNPYTYARDNPVSMTDPSGRFVPLVIAGVCSAGGCEAAILAMAEGVCYLTGACQRASDAILQSLNHVNHPDAQREYDDYKKAYNAPMPPGMDECGQLAWKLAREKALLANRLAWDAKWLPGRHAEAIIQSQSAIRNIEDKMKKLGCPC